MVRIHAPPPVLKVTNASELWQRLARVEKTRATLEGAKRVSVARRGVAAKRYFGIQLVWVTKFQRSKLRRAHIAQSVEHFLGKEEVTGSSPVVGSSNFMSSKAQVSLR